MTALVDGLSAQALGLPLNVQTEHGSILVLSWETGRLTRLLANHPDRKIAVPSWAVPDFDVITGRRFPLPITPPRPAGLPRLRRGRVRLEEGLQALSARGCAPMPGTEGRWRSRCPLCMLRGRFNRRVLVTYDGQDAAARLHCFGSGHTDAELLAALDVGREPGGFPTEWAA